MEATDRFYPHLLKKQNSPHLTLIKESFRCFYFASPSFVPGSYQLFRHPGDPCDNKHPTSQWVSARLFQQHLWDLSSDLSALNPRALPYLPGLVPDVSRRAEFSTSMIVLSLERTLLKGCTTQTFPPVTAEWVFPIHWFSCPWIKGWLFFPSATSLEFPISPLAHWTVAVFPSLIQEDSIFCRTQRESKEAEPRGLEQSQNQTIPPGPPQTQSLSVTWSASMSSSMSQGSASLNPSRHYMMHKLQSTREVCGTDMSWVE